MQAIRTVEALVRDTFHDVRLISYDDGHGLTYRVVCGLIPCRLVIAEACCESSAWLMAAMLI